MSMRDLVYYVLDSGVSVEDIISYSRRCKISIAESVSRLYFKTLYRNIYVDFGGEG